MIPPWWRPDPPALRRANLAARGRTLRAGAGYRELMAECEALLRAVQGAAGVEALCWHGRSADTREAWQRLTVAEAYARHAGIDLLATAADPLCPDAALLAAAAERIGIAPHPGDDWESLFFRIF